jgi:Na+-translocating ferredoxin:NAD+ oxidoreductase RnfE subunit
LFIEKKSQRDAPLCDAAGSSHMRHALADCQMGLCQKIGREEHVVESVSTKNDLIASGELIDGLKNLIPRVLRHEANERVQTDNCLLIEMVKNGRRNGIGIMLFASYRMSLRN